MTRDGSEARKPTGNTVPSVIGTSPKTSPGRRSPSTRSIPSTSLVGSMRPSSTANRARSAPSGAAYSPATRLTSAATRASRSHWAGSRPAKSVTPAISSGVTIGLRAGSAWLGRFGRALLGLAQLAQRALALVAGRALQDQHAVQVVHLVLDHARLEARGLDQALLALLVEGAHAHEHGAVHVDGHAGDREAALLAQLGLGARPLEL